MDQYLSIGDVAKRLGVVPATVKAMVARGRLDPAARTEGGIHLFRLGDVERVRAERAERLNQQGGGDERSRAEGGTA